MTQKIVLLAVSLVTLFAGRATAQEPAYVEDLKFVHELRQRGDTDLALSLLERLKTQGNAALLRELPFEYALCRKAEATQEPDTNRRLRLYEEARQELIKFRDANPNHPRLFETKIDIADISAEVGKTQLARAFALGGEDDAPAAELLKARPMFEAAGVELKSILDELDARIKAAKDPKTPAERAARLALEKALVRAQLNIGLNLFNIGVTYPRRGAVQALQERAKQMEEAKTVLKSVASVSVDLSESWQAQAWIGRCIYEIGKLGEARESFRDLIKLAGNKPAAADGVRLARYFYLFIVKEQPEAGEGVKTIIDECRRWKRDYPRAANTSEGNGVSFMLAEALVSVAVTEGTPPATKKEYRAEADKLLVDLSTRENAYTDRARRLKLDLIRHEGGLTKNIAELKSFDELFMRAQFEINELNGEKVEAKKKERTETVLGVLRRAVEAPDLKGKNSTDVNNARSMLVFYCLMSRRYPEAIKYGEQFAKDDPRSPQAALAAGYALQAYGYAVAERENTLKTSREFRDPAGNKIDEKAFAKLLDDERKRMLDFAAYCEKTWTREIAGNFAREQLARMDFRNGKREEGLKKLKAITPDYPSYPLIQGQIAEEYLKAAENAATDKEKLELRNAGLAVFRGIPKPASRDQTRSYYQARVRLGFELYSDRAFDEMEKIAAALLADAPTAPFADDPKSNDELRAHFIGQAQRVRMLARVGLADIAFRKNDFAAVSAAAAPVIASLKNANNSAKPDPQTVQTLQPLLSMALRAAMERDDLATVREIVAVYGPAIGENPDEVVVPDILRRLIPLIRTRVRELSALDIKKRDDAIKSFTAILDDLKAKQKKQPPPNDFLLVLAQCYASMDEYKKAREMLDPIIKKEPAADDAEAQRIYQTGCVVYLRVLRQQAHVDPKNKATLVKEIGEKINEWTGTNEKPKWGAKHMEIHKERMYLYDLENHYGAGFNKAQKLVQALSAKGVNEPAARDQYFDCYYYMVYFLNASAKNLKATDRAKQVAEAANRIVALETQFPDFGTPEMRKRMTDLMNTEKELKEAYDAAKAKKK